MKKEDETIECSFRPEIDPNSQFIIQQASKWEQGRSHGSIAK